MQVLKIITLKRRMGHRAVLAASFSFLIGNGCMAADDGFMGQPLPAGQSTRQTTSVVADWPSVVLDGLQSNVIRDTLAKVR